MSLGEVPFFFLRQLFRLPVPFALECELALRTLKVVVKLAIVAFEWKMRTVHQTGVGSGCLGLQ